MANTQTTVPTFVPGQVLEAAQLNNSAGTGVPVFATTVTRDAGFGGAGEKTLAEGQLCYLESTNVVQYYDGAAWATLAPAPAASSGLTFISSTNVTGSQVNITGCFSATYESYLIIGRNITGNGDSNSFDFRLGIAGTPNTASDYYEASPDVAYGAGTYITLGQNGTGDVNNFIVEMVAPQLAQQTFFTKSYQSLYLTGSARYMNGYHSSTIQFTDFVLLKRAGVSDFTQGNIKIYGYAAS